jgi:hypothetical protein
MVGVPVAQWAIAQIALPASENVAGLALANVSWRERMPMPFNKLCRRRPSTLQLEFMSLS